LAALRAPFRFQGQITRSIYTVASLAAVLSQYLVVGLVATTLGRSLAQDPEFYALPLRALVKLPGLSGPVLLGGVGYFVIVAWILAALAHRRATNAGVDQWIAAAAIIPILQIPAILILSVMPPRETASALGGNAAGRPQPGWGAASQGIVVGTALVVVVVAIGGAGLGSYGWTLFVAAPFMIGAVTGYLANRHGDIGFAHTATVVAGALMIGSLALLALALEGVMCIIVAAPLAYLIALVGALLGSAIARHRVRTPGSTLSALAILPLAFALEDLGPPTTRFEAVQAVTVDAPPEAVWHAIVHMGTIDAPVSLPFRLGIAYPLGGELLGEGIGAERFGAFSTGTAHEQVTEWIPHRKITFAILQDVPSMHELSPYAEVHAPHVAGSFRTTSASFELTPRPDGKTDLVERTTHELKLEPALYWLPMARWVVAQNGARALTHVRRKAEALTKID
jgi:hypothetical protein